jgi:hypothetical protein
MERDISEKEKEQILNLGAFGYDAFLCSNVLGWPIDEIEGYMKDKQSVFYQNYETGKIRADYVIDLKLFEQARQGDLKALEQLEKRKRMRRNR